LVRRRNRESASVRLVTQQHEGADGKKSVDLLRLKP